MHHLPFSEAAQPYQGRDEPHIAFQRRRRARSRTWSQRWWAGRPTPDPPRAQILHQLAYSRERRGKPHMEGRRLDTNDGITLAWCHNASCAFRLVRLWSVQHRVSPGRRSQVWRRTVCRGRRCRTAAERRCSVPFCKPWASRRAHAGSPGQTGTSDWRTQEFSTGLRGENERFDTFTMILLFFFVWLFLLKVHYKTKLIWYCS